MRKPECAYGAPPAEEGAVVSREGKLDQSGWTISPKLNSDRAARQDRTKFRWRGSALHLGGSKKPVLVLVADNDYPHLFRILYPNGWLSTPANITRARDAAYSHARFLLALTPVEAPYRAETKPDGISAHEVA
jgi:hypothetical protein